MKNVGQLTKQLSRQLSTGSQTQTGSAREPRQQTEEQRLDKLKINNLFETLNLAYPFFLKGIMHVKMKPPQIDKDGNKVPDANYAGAQMKLKAARRFWQMKLHLVSNGMVLEATDKITNVLTIDQNWGPTATQFLSCCRTNPSHQDFDMTRALPPPTKDNREIGLKALDEAKRKLKRK